MTDLAWKRETMPELWVWIPEGMDGWTVAQLTETGTLDEKVWGRAREAKWRLQCPWEKAADSR